MLPVLRITAEHVRDGEYIGPDVSDYAGHIEIAAHLGIVRFAERLSAKGRIRALSGSGISAGTRISAGVVSWRLPTDAEMEIVGEIRSGTIAHGRATSASQEKAA